MIKKIMLAALLGGSTLALQASEPAEFDGSSYYLPKTALKFTLVTERTSYTPGEFSQYAERFFKKAADSEKKEIYRIIDIKISTYGVPDTAKMYTAKLDGKHNITSLYRSDSGVLLAVNDVPGNPSPEEPPFKSARKPEKLNGHNFLSQEILSAGSKSKMAELTAEEIFDLRDSRSRLAKGQAENMPTDGQQLRIMFNSLDVQLEALNQLFYGTQETDTFETVIEYVPSKAVNRDLLFRFSKHFGSVYKDDLSGTPYYISVIDEHQVPVSTVTVGSDDKARSEAGIWVNLPGKSRVILFQEEKMLKSYDLQLAQLGRAEPVNSELFNKKTDTKITLNPITGNLESVKTELKK